MREIRLSGSVEGVVSNHDPYSDYQRVLFAGPPIFWPETAGVLGVQNLYVEQEVGPRARE